MAELVGKTRTNYFKVKDRDAFARLVQNLIADNGENVFLITNKNEEVGFCADGIVYGVKQPNDGSNPDYDGDDIDYDAMQYDMVKQIQELLAPGHACIISNISYDNLRSINGTALVITEDGMTTISMQKQALIIARSMLCNSEYNPDMTY